MTIELEGSLEAPFDQSLRVVFTLPGGVLPEGFEGRYDIAATPVSERGNRLSVRFSKPLEAHLRSRSALRVAASVGIILLALLGIVALRAASLFYFWFDVPVFLYSLFAGGFLVSRFLLAGIYGFSRKRASTPPDSAFEPPTVSIIVPCFNDERWIARTVRQCLDQRFPAERLEVIVVDDGSSDGSHAVLQQLESKNRRLSYVRFPVNRGKREALATGVRRARGEFVVFVDSDSFLDPDAVRHLVAALEDPRIAAVCGHCEVENKWTNLLTRMQAVRYFVGFRVFKAAESVFGCVTCLSGPIACYRRAVILPLLEPWVSQTFFGQPATFGDDRSLTNFVLRSHEVVYESKAICSTIVPSTYWQFLVQQMRWKRSWFRESMRAATFMWRNQPLMVLSFYLGLVLPILAPFIVLRALVLVPFFGGGMPVNYLLGVLSMSLLMSGFYLMMKRSSLWLYGIPFCFFYLFVLVWQTPIAIATLWTSNWGTRGVAQLEEPPLA